MRVDSFCKALLILLAASLSLAPTPSNANENKYLRGLPGLIVIVRHAEREPGDDPPLNAAGVQRAQDLAAALRDVKFSAIITTQLIRTRDTAKPVAAALGLTPEIVTITLDFDAHVKALVDAVRKHRGGAVLIVNHSETVGEIIKALGGPPLPPICGHVYDHLFVLTPIRGKLQVVNGRYGVGSPPPEPNCM